jgi:hypothetical protein
LVIAKNHLGKVTHLCIVILNKQDMQTDKTVQFASQGFMLLSALSLLTVSAMAFCDPQAVMDLVNVRLNNTDAFSSVRGVYASGLTRWLLNRKSVNLQTSR